MTEWIIQLIQRGGYLGIFVLMTVENIVTIIPSELIMGVGGLAVARGTMQFWPLLLAGASGSTVGTCVWYAIGDWLGYARLRPLVRRWGRWLTLNWSDVERGSAFFRKRGQWVVFVMRFSPTGRSVISLPAGLAHMRRIKFLAFTFAGALVWNALLIKGGHWLAQHGKQALHWASLAMLALVLLGIAIYAWRFATWKPTPDDS